jgi:Phage tail sheath protein subtilisin-like domain/Phage tail sheath C-terminal domain
MPFQVSPGVNVSEIDLTTVVPAVSTTEGALAGVFRWGPVEQRILIDSESNLVNRFGKPTNYNAETFFTAANFLSYGNKLYIVRAANTTSSSNGALNALANTGAVSNVVNFVVKNEDNFNTKYDNGDFAADTDVQFIAKYPGALGNSLKVSVCRTGNAYNRAIDLVSNSTIASNSSLTNVSLTVGSNTATIKFANSATGTLVDANSAAATLISNLVVGDFVEAGNSTIGKQFLKITSVDTVPTVNSTHAYFTVNFDNKYSLSTNYTSNTVNRYWEFFNSVDGAPGQSEYQAGFGNTSVSDEVHVVVVDQDGLFTGVPDTVLEVFERVSRATNAKTQDGASNYAVDVINLNSKYVWVVNSNDTGTATAITSISDAIPSTLSFTQGQDGDGEGDIAVGILAAAYDKFASAEDVDVSLILAGKARGGTNGEQIANYLVDNIAEVRKDCVVFISPDRADVVSNAGDEATDIVTFRNSLRSTSYAVLDSGYKYQYDKYNDIYRYVPLNGDTAGLCVRTDDTRDPWFSPAGFNRGQIKNIVKLAYNPSKADRDILYKSGINPVTTFPGQGTVLFGDKTLLSKPSAFDRINVRRLFIVLEKAVATAAKFTLFEFNDEFTRAQFKNLVEPFLRDVQGRRGIYDFKVVCDTSNNTGEVIDRNEFVGDIYIKPARSINFIQLNFVAVRTGVEFSEIVGQF